MPTNRRTHSFERGRPSYDRGASKNKYVVYSQVNRMPLFALEQIVLLSFAVRERGRGRAAASTRKTETRAIRRRDEGWREEEYDRLERPGPSVLFPAMFCLSSWCVLEASSCILTLITDADTVTRTSHEDATNSWRCNRDSRSDSQIASGDS